MHCVLDDVPAAVDEGENQIENNPEEKLKPDTKDNVSIQDLFMI